MCICELKIRERAGCRCNPPLFHTACQFVSAFQVAQKNRETPVLVGGRDPEKRKHFSFEFVLSEPELKAKLSLAVKIFRALNNVAEITFCCDLASSRVRLRI